ncbi:hypothetical protein P775_00270 [Puniceibacterium antarcticum]|uniref:Uncharacterized protein n=1 Tax=Puniceibacterium antarcticum TaxID=1206336 RepID=A0A2G8RL48_9RHOB|nr:hypothetical protein [Puniceibacterium antarcticum]PIL22232.1 hypothetical protein P775_00270 [Puniceibacterium antarcticum]
MPNPPKSAKLKPGVSLTLDKSWGQRQIADFQRLSIDWLREQFGDDVIHARADLDEDAYHIHAVIMPRVSVEMTRTNKKTGTKDVIATRRMLQPSKFAVIEDYEHAQDSVGAWFEGIGLDRGERRKDAFRNAVAQGETPPPKRMHTKTRDWWRKKDRELSKREHDLNARSELVDERSAEADAIIEITEAIGQGVVDPAAENSEGISPTQGHENDDAFLKALAHAKRSPKGASRVAKAFRSGWSTMFKKARQDAFQRVGDDFRLATKTLKDATVLLSNIGRALGPGFSADVGTLSTLTERLKKTLAAGKISYERSENKKITPEDRYLRE